MASLNDFLSGTFLKCKPAFCGVWRSLTPPMPTYYHAQAVLDRLKACLLLNNCQSSLVLLLTKSILPETTNSWLRYWTTYLFLFVLINSSICIRLECALFKSPPLRFTVAANWLLNLNQYQKHWCYGFSTVSSQLERHRNFVAIMVKI